MTIVTRSIPTKNIFICSLAISGNSFVRDISPVTTVEIPAGETHTIQVEHIRALLTQGNNLAINLR